MTTSLPRKSGAGVGLRVLLHYEEKVGLPTSCFGETRYFVSKVTISPSIPLGPGMTVTTPVATPRGAGRSAPAVGGLAVMAGGPTPVGECQTPA